MPRGGAPRRPAGLRGRQPKRRALVDGRGGCCRAGAGVGVMVPAGCACAWRDDLMQPARCRCCRCRRRVAARSPNVPRRPVAHANRRTLARATPPPARLAATLARRCWATTTQSTSSSEYEGHPLADPTWEGPLWCRPMPTVPGGAGRQRVLLRPPRWGVGGGRHAGVSGACVGRRRRECGHSGGCPGCCEGPIDRSTDVGAAAAVAAASPSLLQAP